MEALLQPRGEIVKREVDFCRWQRNVAGLFVFWGAWCLEFLLSLDQEGNPQYYQTILPLRSMYSDMYLQSVAMLAVAKSLHAPDTENCEHSTPTGAFSMSGKTFPVVQSVLRGLLISMLFTGLALAAVSDADIRE
jgi:hypothetical protein